MKILLTGGSGMLGHYLKEEFKEDDIVVLPYSCVLDSTFATSKNFPAEFDPTPERAFDLVVHAAGTDNPELAEAVNAEGTRNLLHGLTKLRLLPKALTYISSFTVYSPNSGPATEKTHPDPADIVGKSKLDAEKETRLWSEASGVPLTILRPAYMFGSGVHGLMEKLFSDVIKGRYVHVRGQEGRIGIVTALDVARAVRLTAGMNCTFNVADESNPRWIDLAEAMTANAGAEKRMIAVPEKWADCFWKYAKFLPAVKASLSPEIRELRSVSLTPDASLLREKTSWQPFNALEVISRREKDYPYETY